MSTRPPRDESDDESPAAPPIPSFASLRDPRRQSAIDLLVPAPPPAAPAPVPTAGPRPAEYADLLRFGVHAARAAAALPFRVARWSVQLPVRAAQRLLDSSS